MTTANDAELRKFRATLESAAQTLDPSYRFWTSFLFHFTSVNNAANILKTGVLASRLHISMRRPEFDDSASPEVIERTEDHWKDYVRFYFRPRTPTLYHNEGIRSENAQLLDAHCPIPIYLFFDPLPILCLPESRFSRETLAKPSTRVFSTADEFAELPFELIYHDSWFSQEDRDEIIRARQAEVIVPKQLNLEYLKLICCRSQAEMNTLRSLLSDSLWRQWRSKIRVVGHQPVFFKKWLYIERVTLGSDDVAIELNIPENQSDCGPFRIKCTVTDDISGNVRMVESTFTASSRSKLRFYGLRKYGIKGYEFRCEIDGNLAYLGRYQESDIPF